MANVSRISVGQRAPSPTPGEQGESNPAPPLLIVTVHGIRTLSLTSWQEDFNRLFESRENVSLFNYQYGYFDVIKFLFPPFRRFEARRFWDALQTELSYHPADTRINIIAHSFGTYLVARAFEKLAELPEERRSAWTRSSSPAVCCYPATTGNDSSARTGWCDE